MEEKLSLKDTDKQPYKTLNSEIVNFLECDLMSASSDDVSDAD